ncbi:MAG: helix-turn-helix transcriptional regulator [Crocinitomicaceae bacterium]|jgi:DNA-binding XRE family transcriptional regulator|nr:helix-turn-helix transcriptional regulator [Crocinitomicaceae bacterium]
MKKSVLARNLRKLRSFKNLNQTEFAELFELNRPTIGSYEEGRSEPKLATLQRIANHFKLTMDDLFSKELTVNQIAGFDSSPLKKKSSVLSDDRLDALENRLAAIEASIRLLAKVKK